MNTVANINNKQISVVNFNSVPVVTTEMLADFYGADVKNIQNNFLRNTGRFVEGEHFFKIVGQELREFKKSQTLLKMVSPNARALTLWTERGAARHAKMLDTNQAWDVFGQLEDYYFHRKEILAKTHKSERTPLHEAHAMLVAKTKHLNSSDAWKIINQRFGTNRIEEIPFEAIPVAVEYVHHLIALYSNADKKQQFDSKHIESLARHALWLNHWWAEFGGSIRKLSPAMGHGIHDHFKFAAEDAQQLVGKEVYMPIFELAQRHDWHKGGLGYKALLESSLMRST